MVEPPEPHRGLSLVLQNSMASPFELARALLEEFYRPVFRISSALLGGSRAQDYTERAFVRAMLDVKSYRESSELVLWFFGNMLKAFEVKRLGVGEFASRAVSDPVLGKIAAASRLPALLYFLVGLEISQIAALLHSDSDMIILWFLQQGLLSPDNVWPGSEIDARSAKTSEELWLIKSIKTSWPAPDASPERLDALAVEIAAQAAHEGEKVGRSSRRRQALVVAAGLLAVLVMLMITSPIKANPMVSRVTIITRVVTRLVTATPVVQYGRGLAASSNLTDTGEPNPISTATSEPGRALGLGSNQSEDDPGLPPARSSTPRVLFASNQQISTTLPEVGAGQLVISEHSEPDQIASAVRASDTRFTSLWIDVLAKFSAPGGYTGADRQYRYQVWANQDQVLILGGSPDSRPSETWVGNRTHLEFATQSTSPVGVAPPDWGEAYSLKRPLIGGLDLLFNPSLWENSTGLFNGRTLRTIGIDQQAGRQALVVEKISIFGEVYARLWIDTQTGLVLRNQQYRSGSDSIDIDIAVQSITYDAVFTNSALFDLQRPWRAGFASDITGSPASPQKPSPTPSQPIQHFILERQTPPPDFAPAHSRLTFLFPPEFDLKSSEVMVSLYGDNYYLGEIWMGNPWTTVCARSPDGSKLAFASHPVINTFYKSIIYWYDLTERPIQLDGLLRINAEELSFSPDNHHLAVLGTELDTANSGVFMVDLQENTTRLIRPVAARSLVWRPDGKFLAMLSMRSRFSLDILVLNPDSGEIVNHSPLIAHELIIDSDQWKVMFPPAPGQLQSCIDPR